MSGLVFPAPGGPKHRLLHRISESQSLSFWQIPRRPGNSTTRKVRIHLSQALQSPDSHLVNWPYSRSPLGSFASQYVDICPRNSYVNSQINKTNFQPAVYQRFVTG